MNWKQEPFLNFKKLKEDRKAWRARKQRERETSDYADPIYREARLEIQRKSYHKRHGTAPIPA